MFEPSSDQGLFWVSRAGEDAKWSGGAADLGVRGATRRFVRMALVRFDSRSNEREAGRPVQGVGGRAAVHSAALAIERDLRA